MDADAVDCRLCNVDPDAYKHTDLDSISDVHRDRDSIPHSDQDAFRDVDRDGLANDLGDENLYLDVGANAIGHPQRHRDANASATLVTPAREGVAQSLLASIARHAILGNK
jgi:hypothetical protein